MRGDPKNFWKRVVMGTGCWEWAGKRTSLGYGRLKVGPRYWYAHRRAWVLAKGPIPSGMRVCHRCDNPSCVRPDHLWLGTQTDNVRDMMTKGRHNPVPKKTHCIHGHAFTPENTRRGKRGTQACRECSNAARRIPNARGPYRRSGNAMS